MEIRLSPDVPVRWTYEPNLSLGTDGGDGGLLALGASPEPLSPAEESKAADDSHAASFPDYEDYSTWQQCLLRSTDGQVDGVLFSTGWGDGFYPTALGEDADGDVVSVVHSGLVVPWVLSGLPGEPPEGATS